MDLRERISRGVIPDPLADEFVADEEAGSASGYTAQYALSTLFADPTTSTHHPGGIAECQNQFAHWYEIGGRKETHPNSAFAGGENRRIHIANARRECIQPMVFTLVNS